jgi:hypothetical membrane protein
MPFTRSTYSKLAVTLAFAASVGDFVVTFFIGLQYAQYNFLTDSQSDLGTWDSPVAVYMNTWNVTLGIMIIACAICLFRTGFLKTHRERLALWLLAIYGAGEGIGSGLFPFNHVNHELTPVGWVHSIFSGIGITAMIVLSFVLLKAFPRKRSSIMHRILLISAITGMIFILLCLLSRKDFIEDVGLWQRLYLLAYYTMLVALTLGVAKETTRNTITAAVT